MRIAKTIRRLNDRQILVHLSEPLSGHSYVVSSFGISENETYLFPADEDGKITDWSELRGSYRGGRDHNTAFTNAGYALWP